MGMPFDAYNCEGLTGLQHAARQGSLTLVIYLLDQGANVNAPAQEKGGLTALQAAASQKYIPGKEALDSVVDCLLEAGAFVLAPPARIGGQTVLESAAWSYALFDRLLALGAPLKRPNNESGPLLHLILARGRLAGGHLARADEASSNGRLEHLRKALDAGVPLEHREGKSNLTPLQTAVSWMDNAAVKILLDQGAQVNVPAVGHNTRTTVQCMLINLPSHDLVLECHIASQSEFRANKLKILELLLEKGADIDASNGENRTTLTEIILKQPLDFELIDFLLQRGASVGGTGNSLFVSPGL